ncbi:MAG: thermonuclease family protein [Wolinella sp.]
MSKIKIRNFMRTHDENQARFLSTFYEIFSMSGAHDTKNHLLVQLSLGRFLLAFKKQRIQSFALSLLFVSNLHAFEAPLSIYGLLREVHSATLFSFFTPNYGVLSCPLYGAMAPINTAPDAPCQVEPKRVHEMRYHARNFTLERLFLEQKYRLGFAGGWCFLQDGAHLFNAILIREGYALMHDVNIKDIDTEQLKKELRQLEEIAKRDKKGLWKEWGEEMKCLSGIAKGEK